MLQTSCKSFVRVHSSAQPDHDRRVTLTVCTDNSQVIYSVRNNNGVQFIKVIYSNLLVSFKYSCTAKKASLFVLSE